MKPKIPLILASQSPRRIEMLQNLNWDFIVHPSDFQELETADNPQDLVIHNAVGKTKSVASHYQEGVIIGVDTIGVSNNEILGKPKNDQDARRIIKLLSGGTHQVISGLALYDAKQKHLLTHAEITSITMDRMSDQEIDSYIASGEGRDKAGAYAIQGLGALFINKIEGDYYNVVGLPIYRLYKLLQQFH